MTGARFGEVDLDLLADYLVGELDGVAESRVAGLVGTDPAWADAFRQLSAADEAVSASLRELAAGTGPMPAEVAAKIDHALLGARVDNVVSLDDRRRQRQRRFKAVSAVAASVLAIFGGVVAIQTLDHSDSLTASSGSAESGPMSTSRDTGGGGNPGAGPGAPSLSGPQVVASGRDYVERDLAELRMTSGQSLEDWSGKPVPGSMSEAPSVPDFADRVPDGLGYLVNSAGNLSACLSAVRRDHPGRPVVVDLARYQGRPAVVILLADPATVVIRTADCSRDVTSYPG